MNEGQDRLEIRELVDRYSFAVTVHDEVMLQRCFATDASWEIGEPFNLGASGSVAIAELVHGQVSAFDWNMQNVGSAVITAVQGDHAEGQVAINEVAAVGGAVALRIHGVYDDTYVRENGVWVFARRRFRFLDVQMGG